MEVRKNMNAEQTKVTVVRSDSGMRDSRLRNELRLLVDAGFDVTLLCWDRQSEFPKRETIDGYTIYRCHLPAAYASRWLFVMIPLWWTFEFFYLLAHKTDCIHACDFDTLVPALGAKLFKNIKVVYDIYDFYSMKSHTIPAFLRGCVRVAERMSARLADGVVIPDAARASFFGDRLPDHMAVAMNCPPDNVSSSWRKNGGGPFVIFYAGLIGRFRGIRKLVNVTAGLDNVKLLFAGWITDSSYETLFAESDHVEYLGLLDYGEALRYTYEADAVYSYYDPSLEINRTANSSKMFDAFMCSTAVLANSEPPSAAVVAQFDCGSLLPYDNDDELRAVIEQWRDDRESVRAKGRNGRTLFDDKFNATVQGKNILDLYNQIGVRQVL